MGESKTPSAGVSKGSRLLALDAIKGIAILLVIWGHVHISMGPDYQSLNYSYVVQYLQAVHMPLFILIAGFFSAKALDLTSRGVTHYWRDKVVRLVVPAVLWHLLLMTWKWGMPSVGGILAKEYWFTLTLFIYFALFYVQRLLVDGLLSIIRVQGSRWIEAVVHLLLTIALVYLVTGITLERSSLLRFVRPVLNSFPCLYPYFVLGYLLKRLELWCYLKTHASGAVSFVLLLVSLAVLRHQELDVPYLSYGLWHICRLMALASFAFLFYGMTFLTERGGWISRALIFLGQWSLPIYLTHYFFLPGLLGMNDYLGAIAMEKRLSVEIFTYSLGALMTLIPTLPVIWLLKCNPYLDYFFYGEIGRLSSKG